MPFTESLVRSGTRQPSPPSGCLQNESAATAESLRGIGRRVQPVSGATKEVAACSGAAVCLEIRKFSRATSVDLSQLFTPKNLIRKS